MLRVGLEFHRAIPGAVWPASPSLGPQTVSGRGRKKGPNPKRRRGSGCTTAQQGLRPPLILLLWGPCEGIAVPLGTISVLCIARDVGRSVDGIPAEACKGAAPCFAGVLDGLKVTALNFSRKSWGTYRESPVVPVMGSLPLPGFLPEEMASDSVRGRADPLTLPSEDVTRILGCAPPPAPESLLEVAAAVAAEVSAVGPLLVVPMATTRPSWSETEGVGLACAALGLAWPEVVGETVAERSLSVSRSNLYLRGCLS